MKRVLVYLLGFAEIGLGLWGFGMIAWLYIDAWLSKSRPGLAELAVIPLAAVGLALPLGICLLRRRRWAWTLNLFLVPVLSAFFLWFWTEIDAGTGMEFLPASAGVGLGGLALLLYVRSEFGRAEPIKRRAGDRQKKILAVLAGAALGATIWAFSPAFTGRVEPWDASGYYYWAAIFFSGLFVGWMEPGRPLAGPLGVAAGQMAAILGLAYFSQRDMGLFPLTVVALLIYSIPCYAGAFAGSWLASRSKAL